MNVEEYWHGTINGYSNRLCRCADCREAWAGYVRDAKERRAVAGVPERVHGTENGYGNYKCRCDDCRDAWSTAGWQRAQRRKTNAG